MNAKFESVEINGRKYVPAEQLQMASKDGLQFVVCRTFSAGVHAGYLAGRNGKEGVLKNAIRIWYWEGAATLSQLATEGVKKPGGCKFGMPVNEITITEIIEVIPCTEGARESIEGVKSWKV